MTAGRVELGVRREKVDGWMEGCWSVGLLALNEG